MDRIRWKVCGVVALASSVTACGGMAMGHGSMAEKNADDAKELDAPLAVGGTIQPDVKLNLQGTASPTLVLVSGRPDVVSVDAGRLTGRSPGVSAILVTTKEGMVIDFYHLWVERATRATLHRLYDDGRDMGEVREGIDVMVGESVVLTPKVYFGAQELAGIVQGQWTVEPALANVLRSGVGERRRLVAGTPGSGKLSVKIANVVVSVPIRVVEGTAKSAIPAPSRASESPAPPEGAK